MSNNPDSLTKMLAIWNTDDVESARSIANETLETNIHFVDPNYNIIGRDAFLDMVQSVHAKIQGPSIQGPARLINITIIIVTIGLYMLEINS